LVVVRFLNRRLISRACTTASVSADLRLKCFQMFLIVVPSSHPQKVCRGPPAMNIVQRVKRRLLPPKEVLEGYENRELVETIFLKTINYKPIGDWPLILGLGTVLDFGGGAGIHYKLACQHSPDIRWAVVETPAMVRRSSELASERLRFFEHIDEAADWLGIVDLIHSNGAIQYVPDALETIKSLCAVRPTTMAWHRVPISDQQSRQEIQTSYLSDNGPGRATAEKDKLVRYARHWICEQGFVQAHEGYRIAERGPDPGERGTMQFRFARC